MLGRTKRFAIRYLALMGSAAFIGGSGAESALCQTGPTASAKPAPAASSSSGIADIVVTARRSAEKLQNVPVAVSVVSADAIAARGSFSPYDLASLATGVSVGATVGDPTNVVYSIRGQNQTYSTLFPSVITYFSEVPVSTIANGNFFDLENVQLLRGPQGVVFGRVTDGGNVLLTPRHPSNEFTGYAQVKFGDYDLRSVSGALNIPVVSDKILVRGAFEVTRRDGYTLNLFNGQTLDDIGSDAFRIGVTLRPTSWLENYTVVNYQNIHRHGDGIVLSGVNPAALLNSVAPSIALFPGAYGLNSFGNILPYSAGLTPLTGQSFVASLQAQLARQQALGPREVDQDYPQAYHQRQTFVVNTTTITLPDDLQFKNIFGYTTRRAEVARYFTGDNSGLVQFCANICSGYGIGMDQFPALPTFTEQKLSDEVRLSGTSLGHRLKWSLGAYFDSIKPDGAYELNDTLISVLASANYTTAHTTSRAGFGSAEYDASNLVEGLKFNAGYRYTVDRTNAQTADYYVPVFPAAAAPALANFLTTVEHLPPAVASYVANATAFRVIPSGQCVTLTDASIFPVTCRSYQLRSTANTWSVGASYQPDQGRLLYAKVSRGYRPGGINSSSPANLVPVYQPETDTSYEAGIKADWRLGSVPLRTNVAVYHDNFRNIQKSVNFLAVPAPVALVSNVAAATINGVEFEGTIKPIPDLTLGVDYAYTHARYKHVDTSGVTLPTGASADPCNPNLFTVLGFCTDNKFQNTPTNQFSITANYRLPVNDNIGRVSFGGVVRYQSVVSLSDTSVLNPAATEPAHAVLDLNANWNDVSGLPIDLGVFVTNVTNKLYRYYVSDVSGNSFIGVRGDFYAPPRMYAVSVKYRFGTGN